MTGRDLIIYILEHGLENEDVFENGIFVTDEAYAAAMGTGAESVKALYDLGMVKGMVINGNLYFLNPNKKEK